MPEDGRPAVERGMRPCYDGATDPARLGHSSTGDAMDLEQFLDLEHANVCRLAILLAMTRTEEEERILISRYRDHHVRAAVTMVSGYGISKEETVIRNVVSLCINTRLIEKKRSHIHPVAHCILETAQSTRAFDAIGQNFRFKVAAIRRGEEFSLSFYGDLGMHALSSHKTIGVGYQILGQ